MTTTAVAHIITADAPELGRPEAVILPRSVGALDEVTAETTVIDRVNIPAQYSTDHEEVRIGLRMFAWEIVGEPVEIERGYYTVAVERIQRDEDD